MLRDMLIHATIGAEHSVFLLPDWTLRDSPSPALDSDSVTFGLDISRLRLFSRCGISFSLEPISFSLSSGSLFPPILYGGRRWTHQGRIAIDPLRLISRGICRHAKLLHCLRTHQ